MKKLLYLFLFCAVVTGTYAENPSHPILHVGTKVAPPFSMKDTQGNWEGISIELWELIAKNLDLRYTFESKKNIKHLLSSVEDASIDVAIAAITITAERESKFDFSHSYYTTGLGIAVPKKGGSAWMTVLKALFSFKMLVIVFALFGILLVIGTITWLMERRRNPEHFNPNPIRGIASGIWWAAVTMTTVGYGDMSPKTLGGRFVALLWMFVSMLLVSSVVAVVASTLTLAKLEPAVSSPNDLAKVTSATIESSISDRYLKDRRLSAEYYDSVVAGLNAVKTGRVDVMVYDEPLLKYTIKKKFSQHLMVVDAIFEDQNYGIAFPEKSPLREAVNREMLQIIHSEKWRSILKKYLGL